jgi:hypothetical protein
MNRIYLLQPDGTLRGMQEAPYDSEALLQELLERYPDLLAGDQMGTTPRRWLLVSREHGVPDAEGAADRWSLDHLFIDHDSVPTLVEVKRSSDTRIRREVVGQMLDYAANAVVYWPVEQLRATYETRCRGAGLDPDAEIATLLQRTDQEDAVEDFWTNVKTNLQAGRIRLVFVADVIPPELRRIVEFLNAQMDPAEVLAVEVRQFLGDGVKTLVPTVIGRTAVAQQRKGMARRERVQWTEERFFAALREKKGEPIEGVARRIYDWVRPRVTLVDFGCGNDSGSIIPGLRLPDGSVANVFSLWTYGTVEMNFQGLKLRPGFASDDSRQELLQRLNAVPGVKIEDASLVKRPNIALDALVDPAALSAFLDVIDWALRQVQTPVASTAS